MNSPALAICACAVLALASPAFSQNVQWDTVGPNHAGNFGNTLSFTDSGKTMEVTAWGYTQGDFNSAFEEARGSQYTIGMGVSNAEEGTGTQDHQMDNEGADDWMLFFFDSMVNDVKVTIDPYGTYDRDVTYYTATLAGPVDLSGLSYSDLAALGFSPRRDNNSTLSGDAREVSITNVQGGYNAILFGAWQGEPTTDSIDRFKIAGVSATYTGDPNPHNSSIPEPSSALLGLLGALALLRRKR